MVPNGYVGFYNLEATQPFFEKACEVFLVSGA